MTTTSDAYVQAIEQALERDADPEWIGLHSPLAAPYLLGSLLTSAEMDSPLARGNALRRSLREVSLTLPTQHQKLLDASFFKRDAYLNINGVAMKLDMSRSAYYRFRATVLQDLAHAFSHHALPPLHLESPSAAPLMHRAKELTASVATLASGRSVALIGNSGVGKTTLGVNITKAFMRDYGRHAFWYTIRPPLNDQLSSFVFSLAYFTRGLGASNTWRQLVADQGKLDIVRALGLIRYDLSQLPSQPLVCVDEVDLLRRELSDHAQIISLLEELRERVPLLLMGGHLVIAPDQYHALTGFTLNETHRMLQSSNVPDLAQDEQQRLHQATGGNPALIKLFIALLQMDVPMGEALAQFHTSPSIDLLLNRIWQRLDDEARHLLVALCVFREPAPRDAWHVDVDILSQLFERGFVLDAGQEGILLPSHVRDFAYRNTSMDVRCGLHLAAGQIYETRGEFTPAAYHYIAGQRPSLAVWTWFNQRERETQHGRAPLARAIFQDVQNDELEDDDDRRALALLRAEWKKLTGEAQEGVNALRAVSWPEGHPASVYAHGLLGNLHEMQGQLNQTLAQYQAGFRALESMDYRQVIHLHTSAGYAHLRTREMAQARQAAIQALFEAEDFMGYMEMQMGNFTQARNHFELALDLLPELAHPLAAALGQIHERLGILAWQTGDTNGATAFLEKSLQIRLDSGDIVRSVYQRINLAATYIVSGQYEQALEQTAAGLQVAEAMQHSYLIAALSASAAEANYYLNRLDDAERYASQALRQEEEAMQPYAETAMGMVHFANRRHEHAESSYRQAIQLAQDIQDRYAEACAWRWLGKTLHFLQRHDEAQTALDRTTRLFDEMGLENEVEKTFLLSESQSAA